MKTLSLLLLSSLLVVSFSGCGTVNGLGEDISAIGGWFKKGSEKVKEGPAPSN